MRKKNKDKHLSDAILTLRLKKEGVQASEITKQRLTNMRESILAKRARRKEEKLRSLIWRNRQVIYAAKKVNSPIPFCKLIKEVDKVRWITRKRMLNSDRLTEFINARINNI